MAIKGRNPNSRRSSGKQGQIVDTAGLAELFGVTKQTVALWRKQGMPIHRKPSDRKYEYDSAAVYQWRLSHENKLLTEAFDKERKELETNNPDPNGQMTGAEAKTRREIANALMAELELAKAQEQVANIEDMMNNFVDALVEVRAKLVSRSSRLAGILAYQDEEAIRDILDKDTADTLEALSDYRHEYVEGETDDVE